MIFDYPESKVRTALRNILYKVRDLLSRRENLSPICKKAFADHAHVRYVEPGYLPRVGIPDAAQNKAASFAVSAAVLQSVTLLDRLYTPPEFYLTVTVKDGDDAASILEAKEKEFLALWFTPGTIIISLRAENWISTEVPGGYCYYVLMSAVCLPSEPTRQD